MLLKQEKLSFYCPLFSNIEAIQGMFDETLEKDNQGLFRGLETILLPNTCVEYRSLADGIIQVSSSSYPKKDCYSLENFLNVKTNVSSDIGLLTPKQLIDRLMDLEGIPYVWGSSAVLSKKEQNFLREFFFTYTHSFKDNLDYLFSGLDCSGLLHFVTKGVTPRNTSELIDYGHPVDIQNKSIDQILLQIQPLDLLVWKGHVVIFLSQDEMIESRLGWGVVRSCAKQRLSEVFQNKRPVNVYEENSFVIRRFLEFL